MRGNVDLQIGRYIGEPGFLREAMAHAPAIRTDAGKTPFSAVRKNKIGKPSLWNFRPAAFEAIQLIRTKRPFSPSLLRR